MRGSLLFSFLIFLIGGGRGARTITTTTTADTPLIVRDNVENYQRYVQEEKGNCLRVVRLGDMGGNKIRFSRGLLRAPAPRRHRLPAPSGFPIPQV